MAPIGNKYGIGNDGGRPPIYATPEELIKECNDYFDYIQGEEDMAVIDIEGALIPGEKKWLRPPEPATITGLSLYLGFDSRSTLYEYAKKEAFSYIIKKCMQRVEHQYEKNLSSDKPTGSIFALKNMGWKDKTETGFTDGNGNDIKPTIQLLPAPNCEPLKPESL